MAPIHPSLPLDAKNVGILQSHSGERIVINHLVRYGVETLAERGIVDCIVVETEDGEASDLLID